MCQNFRSLQKSIKSEVLDALKKYVPDCDATILFLKICHHVTDSYMNPKLSALERIHSIWYGIFVLRSWRLWIYKNDKFIVKENFITQNAYTCIELNGHSLINVLVKCRDDGVEHLLLPPVSQLFDNTFFGSDCPLVWNTANLNLLLNPSTKFLEYVLKAGKVFEDVYKSMEHQNHLIQNLSTIIKSNIPSYDCVNFPTDFFITLFTRMRIYHILKKKKDKRDKHILGHYFYKGFKWLSTLLWQLYLS